MLSGFDKYECSRNIDLHHFISRGKLMSADAARKYCEVTHPEVFMVPVCNLHNAGTKIADSRKARKYILLRLIDTFGADYLKEVIDGVPWKVPSAHFDLTYEGIMAG